MANPALRPVPDEILLKHQENHKDLDIGIIIRNNPEHPITKALQTEAYAGACLKKAVEINLQTEVLKEVMLRAHAAKTEKPRSSLGSSAHNIVVDKINQQRVLHQELLAKTKELQEIQQKMKQTEKKIEEAVEEIDELAKQLITSHRNLQVEQYLLDPKNTKIASPEIIRYVGTTEIRKEMGNAKIKSATGIDESHVLLPSQIKKLHENKATRQQNIATLNTDLQKEALK